MNSTFEEEKLLSDVKDEIIDFEEENTQLTKRNGEMSSVKEEAFEVKQEVDDGDMLANGNGVTKKESESGGNTKEVESSAAFNAHMFLTNEDLVKKEVQEDGIEDSDGGGDGETPMTNAESKNNRRGYKCPVDGCPKIPSSTEKLANHMKKHSAPWMCRDCKCCFLSDAQLLDHYWTHVPFKCDICKRAFTQKRYLQMHRKIHTEERRYKCDVCGYSTQRESSLKRHQMIHTGERPFPCTVCDKKFTMSSDLRVHMRTHSGERPYKCDICGFKTAASCSLKKHKRTHTKEKPYSCTVCDKRFMLSHELNVHVGTHTGKHLYECEICGYQAINSSGLKNHLRSHLKEQKPLSCTTCGFKTASGNVLIVHMRTFSH